MFNLGSWPDRNSYLSDMLLRYKSILGVMTHHEIEFITLWNNFMKKDIHHFTEPYIAWGTPNLKSVRELIYKRGFVKVSSV